MTGVLVTWPLATALLAGDLPYAQRLKKLAPFFTPPPGGEITLDAQELRDLRTKVKPTDLRGAIVVKPPKGQCFTVGRPEQEDVTVCKPTALAFTMGDLDRAGKLQWTVATGAGDFGTELNWHSHYRLAIVTRFDQPADDQPEYRFLDTCKAEALPPPAGRRITVRLLTGETWLIRLPDVDDLLPQPEALPNLVVSSTGGKVTMSEAKERHDEANPDAAQTEKAEKEKEGGGEAPPAPKAPPLPTISNEEDRKTWALPMRASYHMSADHFLPQGYVTRGGHGECRYIFEGPDEDPGTGRLECHDADGFRSVLIPLTCLAQLKPSN